MDREQSARQAVFGTTELLEHILLHLTIPQLLILQRVCRHWTATVRGSKSLQELLLLRARNVVSAPLYTTDAIDFTPDEIVNPMFVRNHRIRLPIIAPGKQNDVNSDPNQDSVSCLPLLDQTYRPIESWRCPTASWRQMLFSDPATSDVIVEVKLRPKKVTRTLAEPWLEPAQDWRLVQDPHGVRAGQVFDHAIELWEHHERKFMVIVKVLPFTKKDDFAEAIEVLSKTASGRIRIAGETMELTRLDSWSCATYGDAPEWVSPEWHPAAPYEG